VYAKQEQRITGLTKQRDESLALAQERERELSERDDLIRVLTQTRDQALGTPSASWACHSYTNTK